MNKKLLYKTISYKSRSLIAFIVLCCVVALSVPSYGAVGNSSMIEMMQQKKVTLHFKNVPLDKILFEIKKQSGLSFMLKSDVDAKLLNNMSLDVENVSVEEALNKLFTGSNFGYTIEGKVIMIIKKPAKKVVAKDAPKIMVTGKVLGQDNKPVVGATVVVEGTPIGAITDQDGAFMFVAVAGSQLEVSFTGKKSVLIAANTDSKPLSIVMEDQTMEVDDVIVTGYQNISKRDAVMSQTTLNADDIKVAGASSITDMLQGMVAGMMVTNESSRVGATPKIKIRGTTTLGNSDPLFVVDGIIQPDPIQLNASSGMIDDMKNIIGDQLSWLNPDDIDKITILKDASATAIYGARASNGVIVVTTKKPKYGDRLAVTYSGSMTVNPRPNYNQFNYMNSQERIVFSEEAFAQGARYFSEPIQDLNTYEGIYSMYLSGNLDQDSYLSRKSRFEGMNTDWFGLLTRTAVSHKHNVSVSGASEKSTYRVSVGYNKTNGVEKENSQDRFTVNSNMTMDLHKKVKLSFGINATIDKTNGYGPGVSPMNYATKTSRAVPAYEEDGSYAYTKRLRGYGFNTQNPYLEYSMLNEMENSNSFVSNAGVNANLSLNWKITDWLTYEFAGGANYKQASRDSYASEKTNYIATKYRGYDYNTVDPTNPWYLAAMLPVGGEKFTSDAMNQSYNIQNKLIFNKQFRNSRLNIMAAMELSSSTNRDKQNTIYGFSEDRGNLISRPTPPDKFKPIGGTQSGWGMLDRLFNGGVKYNEFTNNFVSVFMTGAYSIKDRYVINANVRNDMSNRFGQDINNRFDPTYSFGLSWRISEEAWMEKVNPIFSNITLKATYGIQGNANLSISPELILRQQGVIQSFNDYGASIASIPNPNLTWERTNSWDFGADFRFFDRFNVVVDYYIRKSNAAITRNIPKENGLSQMKINGGVLYNEGIEVTVSFNPVNKKDFGINLSVNSSKNWNRGGKTSYKVTTNDFLNGISTSILKEGYPVSGFWSFEFMGVNPDNGAPIINNLDVDYDTAKADPTTVFVYSGSSEPDFTGGLQFGIRYKNLTLNSSFVLLLGGYKRLNSPYVDFYNGKYLPDAIDNLSKDLNNRWKKPGDEAAVPGIQSYGGVVDNPFKETWYYTGDTRGMYERSTALVVSSSFFRCRDLNLSYRLGDRIVKKVGLNSLRVGASVSNLFVIASKRYKGFDPELKDSVKPQGYSLSLTLGF